MRKQLTYIIRHGDTSAHKIGVASDVDQRLADLQRGNPVKLVLVAVIRQADGRGFLAERRLHQLLAEHRIHGEWFNLLIAGGYVIENWLKQVNLEVTDIKLSGHYIINVKEKDASTPAAPEQVDASIILWLNARSENDGGGATIGDMVAGMAWHSLDEIRAGVARLSGKRLLWATRPIKGRGVEFTLANRVPCDRMNVT